jgi:hypothetical protein
MKRMHLFLISAILACMCLPLKSQDNFFNLISEDTLVAGEANEVFLNVAYNDPSSIVINIMPSEYFNRQLCPDCNDTVKVTDFTIVNDTLLQATIIPPYGIYPGAYMIEAYADYGYKWDDRLWIVSRPYLVEHPADLLVCRGEAASMNIEMYEPGDLIYEWYLGDERLTEFSGNSLDIPSVTAADTGTYTCQVSNDYGSLAVDFNIDVYPFPEYTGIPSGLTELCQGTDETVYSLPANELIKNYTWKMVPDTAGFLNQNESSVTVAWNENYFGSAEIYAETQLEQCAGENSDTLQVWMTGPQFTPEICIVGNDEASGKYMVVWNKLDDASIVAYNIYRESNQAGNYLELGTQPANEFSVFVDETSSPEVFPHSYRISYTDTCGNVSEMSTPHNTIHLSANVGTGGENNLNWSAYTGIAFLTYDIYRGTSKNDLSLLAQINSNVTSYSDFDPPGGMVYYQVVVERDGQCAPTKKALEYNRSSSNIAESGTINVENPGIQMVQVYPNPSNGSFTVSLPESNGVAGSMKIISMTGQLVSTATFEGTAYTLHMDDLPVGVYTLLLTYGERHLTQRLVILK